jgi:hypothetical protein
MSPEVALMKRVIRIAFVALISVALLFPVAYAENFPNSASRMQPAPNLTKAQIQQKMYYGYVPPAPIRHTWPGGYRNIFAELTNTMVEHLLGQY